MKLDIVSAEIVLSFQAGSGRMVISPYGLQKLREHWCVITGLIEAAETPEFLETDYLAPGENETVTVVLGQAEFEQLRPALQNPHIVDYLWCELTQALRDSMPRYIAERILERTLGPGNLLQSQEDYQCLDLIPAVSREQPSLEMLRLAWLVCAQQYGKAPQATPEPASASNATAPNALPETAIATIAVMAIIVGVPSILIAINLLREHAAKAGAADAVTEVPLESLKVAEDDTKE